MNSRNSAATPVTTARGLSLGASSLSPAAALSPVVAAPGARAGARAPFAALPAPRLTPVPTVPAMARPAIPASAISLSVLPEPASVAGPAVATAVVSGSAGRAYEMGRTAGVATAHVGGTDNAPTVLASPRPAATLVATGCIGPVSLAGKSVEGPVPGVRPGLFSSPTADDARPCANRSRHR